MAFTIYSDQGPEALAAYVFEVFMPRVYGPMSKKQRRLWHRRTVRWPLLGARDTLPVERHIATVWPDAPVERLNRRWRALIRQAFAHGQDWAKVLGAAMTRTQTVFSTRPMAAHIAWVGAGRPVAESLLYGPTRTYEIAVSPLILLQGEDDRSAIDFALFCLAHEMAHWARQDCLRLSLMRPDDRGWKPRVLNIAMDLQVNSMLHELGFDHPAMMVHADVTWRDDTGHAYEVARRLFGERGTDDDPDPDDDDDDDSDDHGPDADGAGARRDDAGTARGKGTSGAGPCRGDHDDPDAAGKDPDASDAGKDPDASAEADHGDDPSAGDAGKDPDASDAGKDPGKDPGDAGKDPGDDHDDGPGGMQPWVGGDILADPSTAKDQQTAASGDRAARRDWAAKLAGRLSAGELLGIVDDGHEVETDLPLRLASRVMRWAEGGDVPSDLPDRDSLATWWDASDGGRCLAALPQGLAGTMRHLVVVLDTSGSMTRAEVGTCLSVMRSAAGRTASMLVIQVDSEVCAVDRFEDAPPTLQVRGGGGTDMGKGLALIERGMAGRSGWAVADEMLEGAEAVGVVVVTDGHTPWPPRPPAGCEVVVVLTDHSTAHGVPSWAETVLVGPGV